MQVMLANRPAGLPAELKRQTACKNVNIILFFKYRLFHSRPSWLCLSTSAPSEYRAPLHFGREIHGWIFSEGII